MTEKYQVLARRYRPQRFSDVVGQVAVLQTLKNGIRRGHLAHAYLFSGSRGVGKTTLARLFAKALNCTSLQQDGEPCNNCPSCLDILSGQSLDVIEIDGASNRGIDDIRQINETVAFAPSHGKYKIYIIDEVHMLTKEAFNALLKTLEEPPERAKFFFATTEPHKVLSTIISRCQRFDLGRLLPAQIIDKLTSIARDLNRAVEGEAIHLLAQHADGSLRDAESLFDQILCFSDGPVAVSDVQSALGLVPQELFFSLDKAFIEQRLSYAFELVDELFQSGKDLAHFLEQLIEHYRHIAVAKTLGGAALSFTPALAARYTASAALYSQPQCLAILDLLLKAEATPSRAANPRISLELTLLQVLRMKNRLPIEALIRKLAELEDSLKSPLREMQAPLPAIREPEPQTSKPAPTALKPQAPAPAAIVDEPEPQTSKPAPIALEPQAPAPAAIVNEPEPQTSKPAPTALEPQAPASAAIVNEPEPQTSKPAPTALEPQAPASAAIVNEPEPQTSKPAPTALESQAPASAAIVNESEPQTSKSAPIAPPESEPFSPPSGLKTDSFNPGRSAPQAKPSSPPPPTIPISPSKHPSHYATLMRFAAVELEGTIKN